MHSLDARRIDENFVERPRQRHIVDLAARKLHGDQLLGASIAFELKEIGADRRLHRIDEAPQDAVFVEALHGLEGGFDRSRNRGLARAPFIGANTKMRIEPCMKQRRDLRGNPGVLA